MTHSHAVMAKQGGIAAGQVVPNATEDTFLNSNAATTNYSSDTVLLIGGTPDTSSYTRFGLMRFDLSGIPGGAKINAAALRVVTLSGGGAGSGVWLIARKVKRAYVHNQVTWNIYSTGNNWATAGVRGDADRGRPMYGAAEITSSADGTAYTLDITPLIQEAVDLGQSSVAIMIQLATGGAGGNSINFHSSRSSTSAHRPKCTIDYSGVAPYTTLVTTGATNLVFSTPTTNYAAAAALLMGAYPNDWDGTSYSRHVIAGFDLTNAPAAAAVDSVWLRLVQTFGQNTNETGAQARELLRAFVPTEATWNIWSTGNNWQTAGARGASDRGSTLSPEYNWSSPLTSGRVRYLDVSAIVEPHLGVDTVVRLLASYLYSGVGAEVWNDDEADAAPALLFLPVGASLPQRF